MPISDKLSSIQAELKAPKSQRNSFGGYNYRSCEDILEAAKPLLKKYGCALTLSDAIEQIGTRYYIHATAVLRDRDNEAAIKSEAYAREDEIKKGMDGAQITGAASSYARKYALCGLLAIDNSEQDPDATNDGTSPITGLSTDEYSAIVKAYALGKKTLEGGDYRETIIRNYKPTKSALAAFDADVDRVRSNAI
jgi:hypothetical protein